MDAARTSKRRGQDGRRENWIRVRERNMGEEGEGARAGAAMCLKSVCEARVALSDQAVQLVRGTSLVEPFR